LVSHSDFENSIFWAGGQISGATEGLTLDLLTLIVEKFNLESFLDGGANSGNFGFICLGNNPSIKQIIFAEPLPEALDILKQNQRANADMVTSDKQVVIFDGALTNSDGFGKLYLQSKSSLQFSASLFPDFSKHNNCFIQVKLSKLSSLIVRQGLLPPDVVKLDLEGGEYEAILGFESYFNFVKFFFVEVLSEKQASQLMKLFADDQYAFANIDDKKRIIVLSNQLSRSLYRNVLIFRKEFLLEIKNLIEESTNAQVYIC
jgi:FkbM family methyltransferase